MRCEKCGLNRLITIFSLASLLLLAMACRGVSSAKPYRPWTSMLQWVDVNQGRALAVPVQGEQLELDSKKGYHFRAAAWSQHGESCLRIRTGDTLHSIMVRGMTQIEFPLDSGSLYMITSEDPLYLINPRVTEAKRVGKKVIMIVADTLRNDTVNEETMPALLSFFRSGDRFPHAFSPSSWTLPSVASYFTGETPSSLRMPDGTLIALPENEETLAEMMADQGFFPVGISANYTVHYENGYSRGFGVFHVPNVLKRGKIPDAAWVNKLALEYGERFKDDDLFYYLHYMESHEPYRNHETGDIITVVPTGGTLSEERISEARDAYRSEISYLDRKLVEILTDVGREDRILFTSDHGEEFFDHGGFQHGPTLYPEVVHVPLMTRGIPLDEDLVGSPFSLTHLKSLFTRDRDADRQAQGPVAMETFAHGPPRWSVVDRGVQTILFSEDLFEREVSDPVAVWLFDNHPSWQQLLLDRNQRSPGDQEKMRVASSLVNHFHGWRKGIRLFYSGTEKREIRVNCEVTGGFSWGDAEAVTIRRDRDSAVLSIDPVKPFTYLMLDVRDKSPDLIDLGTGKQITLKNSAPAKLEGGKLFVWSESGGTRRRVRGMEETIKRLKSLGYIR